MNNIIISTLDEQFKKDCKVINLKYEYPGYTGIEQWAIITDLSEEELCAKYAEQITTFRPFIILSASYGLVRDDFIRNEHKHEMRQKLYGDNFDLCDNNIEAYHPELITDTLFDEVYLAHEAKRIKEAIEKLSKKQKNRVCMYFFQGKTVREIAKLEGVNHSVISKSINFAIKNLKNFLK